MKTKHLAFFLFLFFFNANAQEFKLGKVSIAELEQKVHPKDSTAVAAILYKKGKVTFEFSQREGFVMITEVTTRIKIYKKDGYDWATKSIDYGLDNNRREDVTFSNAVTYNLVGGKIEKTKLKSEGEFDEIYNKYHGIKKITMPNVKEGSVIEFQYVLRSPNFAAMRDWYFQNDIPVDHSEFTTYIPEYYVYKPNLKGFILPKISNDTRRQIIPFNADRGPAPLVGGSDLVSSTANKLEFNENITTYIADNLPAMKEEGFVNNIDNYTTSVGLELTTVKYPNSKIELFSTDWESVAKKIYDNEDFGLELNKTGYFENDLIAVTAGLTAEDEIISAILNYVKSTVKWNDYNSYFCNDGVKKAYKDKIGNAAEINLMLTAMLRAAGLKSNPVLISTRENGIAIFPNRTAFNYVIAAVESPSGLILLDATSKFSTPNVLPFRDLNWLGRLIRKDGTSEEVDLMPKKASNDNVFMNYAIDATGKITGKLRRQRTDYNAMAYRSKVENIKEEEYLEKLENENEKIEIAEYSRTNEKDILLPVIETCSFSGTNLCDFIGEKMYINPMLFFTKTESPFKQDTREYPIDFGFPFIDKYLINIQIPDGYAVESLPSPAKLDMEDGLGSCVYLSNVNGNSIQISISHQINTPIVPADYYSMLKDFYLAMINKETEKIILKKV